MNRTVEDKRFVSLATRFLIIFIAGAVVPLVVLGAFQVITDYASQSAQVGNLQRETARNAAIIIDAYLARMEEKMTLTVQGWALQADTFGDASLGRLLGYNSGFDALTLMDETGQEVAKASRHEVIGPGDLGNRANSPDFRTAQREARYLGPVSLSQYNEPFVVLSIRVEDKYGQAIGVLSAEVNLKYMWDVIADMEIGSTGYAYVVNEEGWLIAHRNPSKVLQRQDLSGMEGVRQALQDQTITGSYTGLEGQDVIGSYQPLRQTDWFVLVETPTQEALADVYRTAITNTAVIAIFLVLATLLGWYTTRIVVQPLNRLQDGATIIGGGDLTHRIAVQTQDEIGALASAFNDMAAQLQDIIHTLEQREEERLHLQQQIIETQQKTLKDLSTPIIPVMDRIIVMPLIGSIDTTRARDITRSLLAGIHTHRAKVVILDITGVPVVDTGIASYLNKTIQAARLKGAHTIVTGISDAVAETIVDLMIDWSGIETVANLQTGLRSALAKMGQRIEGQAPGDNGLHHPGGV